MSFTQTHEQEGAPERQPSASGRSASTLMESSGLSESLKGVRGTGAQLSQKQELEQQFNQQNELQQQLQQQQELQRLKEQQELQQLQQQQELQQLQRQQELQQLQQQQEQQTSLRTSEIEIFMRTLQSGRTETIRISRKATVGDLKRWVTERVNIHQNEYRLEYQGRSLEEHCTLEHYNINHHSTVNMMGRLRGGNNN